MLLLSLMYTNVFARLDLAKRNQEDVTTPQQPSKQATSVSPTWRNRAFLMVVQMSDSEKSETLHRRAISFNLKRWGPASFWHITNPYLIGRGYCIARLAGDYCDRNLLPMSYFSASKLPRFVSSWINLTYCCFFSLPGESRINSFSNALVR